MLFFIIPVGIRKAQFPERGGFPGFHFPGLFIRNMIKAQKMQSAMHHHVSPVLLRSFVLLPGFPFYDAFADHKVAEVVFGKLLPGFGREILRKLIGEGEHIGGSVHVPVLHIKSVAFILFGNPDGHGGVICKIPGGGFGVFHEICFLRKSGSFLNGNLIVYGNHL